METLEKARRLVRAATGEDYGDGYTVTDICVGYAEPGYGTDEAVIVFGNWNTKRYAREGDAPLTKEETLPARLAEALERFGIETEWLDEWVRCGECYRAMRTQADSYTWKMYGAYVEDAAEYICADCLRKDLASTLAEYINDTARCVTFLGARDLEEDGWSQYAPNHPHTYQNGWHEGMDDRPEDVFAQIRAEMPTADVLFLLDEASQFYISFSAWTKEADADTEDGEE